MKMTIGVILGIILGVVIIGVVVGVFVFNLLNIDHSSSSTSSTPAPATSVIVSSPNQSTTTGSLTAAPPSAGTLPTGSPPVSPSAIQANVNFELNITNISQSGLSATVNAELKNSGQSDAHNVRAIVEVYSQGSKVNVTGDTSLNIGTLKSGETVTKQATFNFSLLDAPKLMQNGATINLTMISDEKTQTLTYELKP